MSAVEKAVEAIEADARRYTEVRVSSGARELNVTIDSFARLLSRHLAEAGLLVTDEMRAVLDAAIAHRAAPKGDWWRFDKELHAAVDAYLAARGDL